MVGAGSRRLISVVGAGGFLGARVAAALAAAGVEHRAVRGRPDPEDVRGTVVWCRGATPGPDGHSSRDLTATHVSELIDVIDGGRVDRVVYLSSIAMYRLLPSPVDELTPVVLDPAHPLDVYAAMKVAAEAVLHQWTGEWCVLRLAKVVPDTPGRGDFLDELLTASVTGAPMRLRTSLRSAKDYLAADEAVAAIVAATALAGRQVVNVGSGRNVTNGEIVEGLRALAPLDVEVEPGAPDLVYGAPDVRRAAALLGSTPASLLDLLPRLRQGYVAHVGAE